MVERPKTSFASGVQVQSNKSYFKEKIGDIEFGEPFIRKEK